MSNPQDDDAIETVTAAEVGRVAEQGLYSAPSALTPAAGQVAEALIATLKGLAGEPLLPADLQQLVDRVRQKATIGFPWITTGDGVKLSAHTIRLNTDERRPVVIVPAGWTPFGWALFEWAYLLLADRGYHVLAYTPRGLGTTIQVPGGAYIDGPFTSGGTIDVAGEKDWADGSTVIDYAQQHFNPSRVGFLGESYGSGISQLVAAHDERNRVAAVVALSTWSDLAESLYHHDTRHLAAVTSLINFTGGPKERKFDEETRRILDDFEAGENLDRVVDWAETRSPSTYLDRTNTRRIPTFFSNTWHETLFPAGQLVRRYDELTAPKHLNLWIGDHAAPEGAALTIPFSGPNVPLEEAFAWLDHYLLDAENDVPSWPALTSQVMFTYETRTDPSTGKNVITTPAIREPSPTWSSITTATERWYLTEGSPTGQDGGLAPALETGWTREFTTGQLTDATAVDAIITTGQAEWTGNPKTYDTDKFDRQHLAVWTTPEPPDSPTPDGPSRRIRGIPELTLTLRNTATSATVIAYLFDLAPDNTARIITHEPLTLPTLTPHENHHVTWPLQPTAYDLPPGHRLMLVLNSKDQLYSAADTEGSRTTITSLSEEPAQLSLPLG
ncbi:CocE/NonD family hydrolase [Streptomyces sp. NPDC056716]|uniref:CocE/NonD family hydrolase n=1 Tax=unclassified Streptomyces TaxID=2593676 RepID=UPI0036A652B1